MSDRKENVKPRRQLPAIPIATPEIPRSLHSVAEIPVAPTNLYSASPSVSTFSTHSPPPLPARPQSFIGTSHTTYVPDASFREPELVSEDKNVLPDQHILDWAEQSTPQWSTNEPFLGETQPSWPQDDWANTEATWGGGYTRDWSDAITMQRVEIDGRNEDEEINWWDPSVREKYNRPGPGFLPTQLETFLHDPDHSLYHVTATPPDLKPSHRHRSSPPATEVLSQSSTQPVLLPPPTPEEVRTAIPHPNAYYCRRHNGWVLLLWKSSSVEPPLAKSYLGPPLPDQARRRKTSSCIGEGAQPFGQMNKTHHFHLYKKAIDASKLNPPFLYDDWDAQRGMRQKRRNGIFEGSNSSSASLVEEERETEEEEGELFDLFLCCQCSFYCVASEIIPGVVPVKYFEDLTREKTQAPQVGKSPEVSVSIAWETILM
jgi:ubiquitin carboxyl-terminal hydrolase 25